MKRLQLAIGIIGTLTLFSAEALNSQASAFERSRSSTGGYLQCVPYARQVSGIEIYGDAHRWWGEAAGRFARGNTPKVGAVMAFLPHANMRLGHVAAVSRIIDSRTVMLKHANWSPINGRRGQIENNVRAVDVSPANDWTKVRVWYAPTQALGRTEWPVHGFIYNEPARAGPQSGLAERPNTPRTNRHSNRAFRSDPIGAIIAGSHR